MATNRRYLIEYEVEGKRLGRHIAHDDASRNFEAKRAASIGSVKHHGFGLPLTQDVGSCTAEALIGAGNSQPNYNGNLRPGMPRTQTDAMRVYGLETQMEGQPYPPNDPGGSGLMVCKAGVQLGLLKRYEHAFGLQHALEALTLRPVITGINWYDSMDTPGSDGGVVITPDASVRGGHEILAEEIVLWRRRVWFYNSWGAGWGFGGRFWMSFNTWERLLGEQGDVTVPIFV